MPRTTLTGAVLAAMLLLSPAHAVPVTINAGGSSLAGPTYIAEFAAYNAANQGTHFTYEAVGSGAGQNAFLNNDVSYLTPGGTGTSNLNGYGAGVQVYPALPPAGSGTGTPVGNTVHIGASDIPLTATQVSSTGTYVNATIDGPLIQVPTFGVPVALAYNQSAISNNGLTLTEAQICGVLSGKITDWHTLNSTIPAGTTIKLAYFSNSSGTTYLVTQHLNATCTAANSNFSIPVKITKTFASLFKTVPLNFTGANASAQVASQLIATPNSFGYLSPDFTSIAPLSASTSSLQVASIINSNDGRAYLPTILNTQLGLANGASGSSNTTPPATAQAAANPLLWVPVVPQTMHGYPIVGYGTFELSSCYASKPAGNAIGEFLNGQYHLRWFQKIIKNNGFAPLADTAAAPFVTAVTSTFITNSTGYNLDINDFSVCATYAGR